MSPSTDDVTLDSGGFTLNLSAVDPAMVPAAAGRTCPGIGTYGIGNPPPTPSAPGGLVENFEGGAGVFCVVAPQGTGLYVDVSAVLHVNTPEDISLQISSDGVDAVNGTTAAGLLINTPPTSYLQERQRDTCTLAPIHELSPGAIYANFDCPMLAPITTDDAACAASGTIEFRYCDSVLDN